MYRARTNSRLDLASDTDFRHRWLTPELPRAAVAEPDPASHPTFPASDAVATHSEGVYPVAPVVVSGGADCTVDSIGT
jgi:hypothetical protein